MYISITHQDSSCQEEDEVSDQILLLISLDIFSHFQTFQKVVDEQKDANGVVEAQVWHGRQVEHLGGVGQRFWMLRIGAAEFGHKFFDVLRRDRRDEPERESADIRNAEIFQTFQNGPLVTMEA